MNDEKTPSAATLFDEVAPPRRGRLDFIEGLIVTWRLGSGASPNAKQRRDAEKTARLVLDLIENDV